MGKSRRSVSVVNRYIFYSTTFVLYPCPFLPLSLQDTRHFAITGVDNQSPRDPLPFGAYGTLSDLNDTSREEFLDQCPELKLLYPPMHSPLCFGAVPDPLGCFKCVIDLTSILLVLEIVMLFIKFLSLFFVLRVKVH